MNHAFVFTTHMRTLLCIALAFGMIFCKDASAQGQGTITGTVTEAQSGETIPGVNVIIAGTQQGSVSDSEGAYRITDVAPGTYNLQASFIGYATETVEGVSVAAGQTVVVDIELLESAVYLEDVVVTALGVEREERSLTTSAQEINTAYLAEARELNVATALTGQIAGMSVTQAGTGVGSSARVILRGNRSINGNSQPLYVVDGVPIRGEVTDLSPDDIENISVLKGPNAAALYGSAAQNGAVIITTRRARAGQIDVSFSQNFMFTEPLIFTEYQDEYGQGSGGEYISTSEFSWGARMNGQMVNHWSPGGAQAGTQYALTPQPDNVRDAFRTGYSSATNLTAHVGTNLIQSVFSYSYTSAQGVVQFNDLERHNFQVRAQSQPTDRLLVDGKISFMRQDVDNELSTGENFANPLRHIYRLPRNIQTEHAENFEYLTSEGQNRQHYWNPGSNGGANPYWTLNRNLNRNTRERAIVLASATYSFTDYLEVMIRGSYDGESGDSEAKLYNDSYIIADNGRYSIGKSNASLWNGDALISYNDNLSRDFRLNVNLGGSIRSSRGTSLSANTGTALTVPNFFAISNTQNVVSSVNIGSPSDVQSIYSFAQIAFRDAIYLDVTGRNDWSSTLPAENRSYFYPSFGVSAIISDLIPSFPDVINFARLRASWATVGNSAPPFQLARAANFSAGGNNGFLQLSPVLPNPDLKPEETVSTEFGLDVRVFRSRLGLDATYYKTNTRDQLFTVALPIGSGAGSLFTNGGNVENKGVELVLSARPVDTRDFNWDLDVNFARNRNMVVEISDEAPSLQIGSDFLRRHRIEEGAPYGQVYSRGFERDSQGRVIVGENGMPLITDGLTVNVANFNPDWLGSIRSTFTYKNVSASFLIDHRQGGTIASLTNAILYADGATEQTLPGRDGGLIFGENFFADETAVLEDGSPNNIEIDAETFWRGVGGRNAPVGEAFVVEATNTRLREATITYRLPQSVLTGMPVSNLQISLVGRNLFFLHRKSENLDPDIMVGTFNAAEGFESFTPPTTRSFGFHLSIRY